MAAATFADAARGTAVHVLALLAPLVATPADGLDFWLPMSFIIGGVLLFLWEVSMPGFFVAIPATVVVILGLIGIFVEGFFTNALLVLLIGIVIAAPTTYVTMRIYRRLAPPDAPPTTTTGESLVGRSGTVMAPVDPDTMKGKVRIEGVVWSARSLEGQIQVGEKVVVVQTRGVHVVVERKESPAPGPEAAVSSS